MAFYIFVYIHKDGHPSPQSTLEHWWPRKETLSPFAITSQHAAPHTPGLGKYVSVFCSMDLSALSIVCKWSPNMWLCDWRLSLCVMFSRFSRVAANIGAHSFHRWIIFHSKDQFDGHLGLWPISFCVDICSLLWSVYLGTESWGPYDKSRFNLFADC